MPRIFNGTARNDRLIAPNLFPFTDTVQMNGLAGDDYLEGAFLHYNHLIGGLGHDTLKGGASGNLLDGGDGNDLLDAWIGSVYNTLRGGAGNDRLVGGSGGNLLDGGLGADTMVGGDGADTYVVNSLLDQIQESFVPFFQNVPNPRDLVQSSISWTLGSNLEDLTLIGQAAINGTGNGLSNVITGNAGNNILLGMAGSDTLSGGAGADKLDGGTGNDVLDGGLGNDLIDGGAGIDTVRFTGTAAIKVNLYQAVAQVTGQGIDTIRNVENVTSGAGNDVLYGSALANTLDGGAGQDLLWGLGGNDRLLGGAGNDTLRGGLGDDTLTGGQGQDRFVFALGDGNDRITDFTDLQDRIVIQGGPKSFNQLTIADLGADARISFGNVSITLTNFDHRLLGAEDFIFA